jgi:HEAT repeat protein
MTRQDVIESILHMLRPLGPMGDPETREQEEAAWATQAAGDISTIAALVGLASNPPTAEERGRTSDTALQDQLAHVLALIGASVPEIVIDLVGPLTNDQAARAAAIEVIGAIGDPAGLRWIAPLVGAGDLSDHEATWLASALGEIGTPHAKTLLEYLGAHTAPERTNVLREIQIALDTIARRGTQLR